MNYAIVRVTIIDPKTGQPRPIYYGHACRVEFIDSTPAVGVAEAISYVVQDGTWTRLNTTKADVKRVKKRIRNSTRSAK